MRKRSKGWAGYSVHEPASPLRVVFRAHVLYVVRGAKLSSSPAIWPVPFAYAIDPDLTGEPLKLRVDLSFRLIGVRGVDLQLPSEWEGIQNLYKAIRDIEALSPQTSLRDARDPARRHLIFPSGQIVHMRYWVVPDWEGDVSSETYFHAILQKKYFQLAGRHFLFYPSLPEDEESLVRSRIIVAVSSGSEANKAGLRNGQTVLEHGEIRSDDPNSAVSVTVRDSAGEREVTYFPRRPAIHVDQYATDALKIKGTTQCDLLPAHR